MDKGPLNQTDCCDDCPIVIAPPPVNMNCSYQDFLSNGMWESSGVNGTVVLEPCPAQIQQNSLHTKTPAPTEQQGFQPDGSVIMRHQEAVPLAGISHEQEHKKKPTESSRNRTSSYEFRQKQKLYVQNLEQRVAELTSANAELQSRMHLLVSENNIIKEHLRYLRMFVSQAVSELLPPSSGQFPGRPSGGTEGLIPPPPPSITCPGSSSQRDSPLPTEFPLQTTSQPLSEHEDTRPQLVDKNPE